MDAGESRAIPAELPTAVAGEPMHSSALSTDHWQALATAVAGSRKKAESLGDDAVALREWRSGQSAYLLAACADGAGSAQAGALGSRAAVDAALAECLRQLQASRDRRRVRICGAQVAEAAAEAVRAEAQRVGLPPRELATTLTCVVAGPRWTWVGQVGDGAAVVKPQRSQPGDWRVAIWPERGEYANTTHFLTGLPLQWQEATLPRCESLALLTDGLLPLGLDLAHHSAFVPFFEGMMAELRRAQPQALLGPLRSFLASPRVAERTDDDVSLVLALRPPRGLA